jgi:hypothetical protein
MNKLVPLLYNAEMAKAHSKGEKTETRRLNGLGTINSVYAQSWIFKGIENGYAIFNNKFKSIKPRKVKLICETGDYLWFRETWMNAPNYPDLPEKYYYKSAKSKQFIEEWPGCWRPSIHMPLAACRLFALVKEISIEEVLYIDEVSAQAEGVKKSTEGYIKSFTRLWEETYGTESLINDFVWVIKFESKTRTEVESALGVLQTETEKRYFEKNTLPW